MLKRDLRKLLRTPTWSTKDLQRTHATEITRETLIKTLRMSGLSTDISPEREQSLLASLRAQMSMIKSLYAPGENDTHKTNADHFRLIASDHTPPKPLDLPALMGEIDEAKRMEGANTVGGVYEMKTR